VRGNVDRGRFDRRSEGQSEGFESGCTGQERDRAGEIRSWNPDDRHVKSRDHDDADDDYDEDADEDRVRDQACRNQARCRNRPQLEVGQSQRHSNLPRQLEQRQWGTPLVGLGPDRHRRGGRGGRDLRRGPSPREVGDPSSRAGSRERPPAIEPNRAAATTPNAAAVRLRSAAASRPPDLRLRLTTKQPA
jgi:hypothetical protein